MGTHVRLAERDDLERINAIRKQVNELHVQGRPDQFRAGWNEALQAHVFEFFSAEQNDVLLAEQNGSAAGYAMIEYIDRPETPYSPSRRYAHVMEFGVDAAYRRCGIGHALMDAIKRRAKKRGYTRIELDMWTFNESALAFYETEGFSTIRRYMEWEAE